jgi:cephalosporin hydroxylase
MASRCGAGSQTEVARTVPDRSLGFVYIDANHVFEHVVADIAAWAPKVRSGGIVAGHDFGRSSVGQVKEAVEAWVATHGIERWFVLTGDRSPSWAWVVR